jgi:DNA-binding GntR family transcriptional regulator
MGKELEAARSRGNARRIMLLNEQFHFALYEAAGIRVLTEIIATLWLQSAPTLNLLFRPENIGRYPLSEQNRHNRALLRALRVRDGRAAARAVAAEIAVGSRALDQLMRAGLPGSGQRRPARSSRNRPTQGP